MADAPVDSWKGLTVELDAGLEGPAETHEFRFAIKRFSKLVGSSGFKSPLIKLKGVRSSDWLIRSHRESLDKPWKLNLYQVPTEDDYQSKVCLFFVVDGNERLRELKSTHFAGAFLDEIAPEELREDRLTIQCRLSLVYQVDAQKEEEIDVGQDVSVKLLLSDIRDMYVNQKDCDVTIRCGDEEFKAHKNILSARSRLLARLVEKKDLENFAEIESFISLPEVKAMLHYVYTGELGIIQYSELCDLCYIALKYDLKDLKQRCLNRIASTLSVENICSAAILAHDCKENDLMVQIQRFFNSLDFDRIEHTSDWKRIVKEYPELVVKLMRK